MEFAYLQINQIKLQFAKCSKMLLYIGNPHLLLKIIRVLHSIKQKPNPYKTRFSYKSNKTFHKLLKDKMSKTLKSTKIIQYYLWLLLKSKISLTQMFATHFCRMFKVKESHCHTSMQTVCFFEIENSSRYFFVL